MDPYASFLRQLFRLAGELWFQRVNEELWKFSEPFYNWLYELFEHPRRQWRENLAAFLAEQEAEGRTLEPRSKRATLEYLIAWEATVDWAAVEGDQSGEPNLAVLGPLEGAMLDGTTVPDFQFDPRELGLAGLPDGPIVPPPDVGEPELPPLVSSAQDYRRRQIAAHGDSSLTTALVSLNQAINRYLFRLEDRHQELESPGERRANDVADFAAGVAELSLAAASALPRTPAASSVVRTKPLGARAAVDKAWKALIEGKAQKTGTAGHAFRSYRQAIRMAKSGQYDKIWLNRAYSTTTGTKTTPRRLPDVIGRRKTGQFDAFEVPSKTNSDIELIRRNVEAMEQLPASQQGDVLLAPITRSKK